MSKKRHSFNLTSDPSTLIPNYEIIRDDARIGKIINRGKFPNLSFLHDPKYALLRKTVLFGEKRIFNIPRKRTNNWNNYIVHRMNPDHLESWRENCKVPENWIGPQLKSPC